MHVLPEDFMESIDKGWNHVMGPLLYPLAVLSTPAAVISYAFPQIAIWTPGPTLIAYGFWIGVQYHLGKTYKNKNH